MITWLRLFRNSGPVQYRERVGGSAGHGDGLCVRRARGKESESVKRLSEAILAGWSEESRQEGEAGTWSES